MEELPAADWPVGGRQSDGMGGGAAAVVVVRTRDTEEMRKDGGWEQVRGWERGRVRCM